MPRAPIDPTLGVPKALLGNLSKRQSLIPPPVLRAFYRLHCCAGYVSKKFQGLKRRQDALQFFLEQLLEPVLHAKLNSTTSCLIRTFLQCPGEVGVQAASSGQTGGGEGQDIEVDVGDVGDVVNVDAHRADHADSGGDEPRWYRADADNQITADGLDPENEAIV